MPVAQLPASPPRLPTFLVNRIHEGDEYAVSSDFDSNQLADLLRKAEGRMFELWQGSIRTGVRFGTSLNC
jgi:hypothetical protein